MIAIDTNVLVRYVVNDDGNQAHAARELLDKLSPERPGFVSREVVLELVWVLGGPYEFSRNQIAGLLEDLVGSEELVVEAAQDVIRAANACRSGGAEFSDRMILAACQRVGAETLYTFDRLLGRLPGATLIDAAVPAPPVREGGP